HVHTGATGVELVLEETQGYSIQGTVVDAGGEPIPSFKVTVGHEAVSGTQQSSSFTLHCVPAGATKGPAGAPAFLGAERSVAVGPDSPGPLRFVLERGGTGRGRVLDARGTPVADARVGEPMDVQRDGRGARTDGEGRFALVAADRNLELMAVK